MLCRSTHGAQTKDLRGGGDVAEMPHLLQKCHTSIHVAKMPHHGHRHSAPLHETSTTLCHNVITKNKISQPRLEASVSMDMKTILIHPTDTEQSTLSKISNDTRFAILYDPFPGNPVGYGRDTDRPHWLHTIINQFPNCTFIIGTNWSGVKYPNMVSMQICILQEIFCNDYTYEPDWGARQYTTSIIGGQTRINRTMASFWLAHNYPKDQLRYHYTQNNDLSAIAKYITTAKNLRPRRFLLDTWHPLDIENNERAVCFLLPDIISKAYINLGVESVNPQLEAPLTEKTLQAWLGGTLFLPLGEHEPHKEIESLGFESFSDVFDFTCSSSKSHHDMTIGLLESNKDFIIYHDQVEQAWHDNLTKIKHNHRQSTDKKHWQSIYKDELKVLSEAVKLMDFSQIHRRLQYLKFFIQ